MRRGWIRTLGAMGVVLVGAALAPPRPAQAGQAPAQVGQAPAEAGSGALFLRGEGDADWDAAPVLETDVGLRITGLVVRARVVQRFVNPGDRWLEGLYVFPLPELAAVDHLDMRVGDRVIEGRIQERERARRSYARARTEGRKASLVEQERPNVFTTRLANVGPGETVEVAIEYQETLRWERTGYRLRVPLVVAPRYVPAASRGDAASGAVRAAGPAAMALDPPDAAPLNPVRLQVEIEPGFPVERLVSPTHAVFAQDLAEGRVHRVFLQDYADRDFVLEWSPAPAGEPRAALFSERLGDETHVLLVVMPPGAGAPDARLAREVVFVVDTSGSMGGAAIRQARSALLLALDRLGPDDRFDVIRFAEETELLFGSAAPADADHLARARDWVRDLEADGGTEMGPALEAALRGDTGHGEVRQVVFITDGSIADEEALFAGIERDLGRSRLFTVGIGSAPNGFFLKRAARFGRGTHTFVSSPAEVDERMGGLLRKIERPVLGDLEVLWNDEVEMWPARVPDLYDGEPVVVAARVSRFAGDVRVRGRRDGRPWEVSLPLEPGTSRRGIGVLWARRKIAALMDGLASGADAAATRDAVVAVALEHHLVSRWTSLVAVDVTPSRPGSEPLASRAVPSAVPAGSELGGVLPRGATPAPLLLLAGALLAAAGWALGATGRSRG